MCAYICCDIVNILANATWYSLYMVVSCKDFFFFLTKYVANMITMLVVLSSCSNLGTILSICLMIKIIYICCNPLLLCVWWTLGYHYHKSFDRPIIFVMIFANAMVNIWCNWYATILSQYVASVFRIVAYDRWSWVKIEY